MREEIRLLVLSCRKRCKGKRDREAKRRLYSRRSVHEYWIADWRAEQVAVYRRQEAELRHVQTLLRGETLTSALLPGFACGIDRFFDL